MCCWMLCGTVTFYAESCGARLSDGLWATLQLTSSCNAWVIWVGANAFLHAAWVSVLAACQTYQVVWLGMTTNERMNKGRYRHFQVIFKRKIIVEDL